MKFSLVVPIYNDGALAEDFCREARRAFAERLGEDEVERELEIVFVDDGSRNDSLAKLRKAAASFPFVKVVALSRNFGQHIAISCGYRHARGEVVGYLNVDQEDPPDQVLLLADALAKGGHDIVGGLYEHRDVPFVQRITSQLFNVFMTRLTGWDLPTNAATVRVMSRRFIDHYNALTEKSRFLPGLEVWLGFSYGHVVVRHQRRKVGTSSYNFRRRLRMATDSIISFSDYPLRLSVKMGLLVTALGLLITLAFVIDKLFFRELLPGYVSTLAAITVIGGAQIFVTGVGSLYIGRILAEVQARPLYVVRERIGDLPEA